MIFRVQLAQFGQRQVFEQDAAKNGGVGGQAGADIHRGGEHRRRRDLGHVNDRAAVAHHQIARVVEAVAQAGQQRLTELGQFQ
ncbi:hypothetical protein D3C71_990250 [compost metagenome]